MASTLEERITAVNERVERACAASNRHRDEVNIIAVTKYVSGEMLASVLDAGLCHIGENRWQDAKAKWESYGDRGVWHFIGHLQTNKVKDVVGRFPYIHSLDRLSLAQELQKKAEAADTDVQAFLQVNISGEETKYGLAPEDVPAFLKAVNVYNRIKVIGLMTMAPLETEPEAARPVFRGLRELRDKLNEASLTPQPITELSMGMSNDFEIAIEEGATWIRLGTVLVGHEEGA